MTRLYLEPAHFSEDEARLIGDAARRLRDVLRLRPGAELRVFDGAGHERTATVAAAGRGGVTLALGAAIAALAEPPVPVTLACAFPRGQRGDWIIEKATELGATHLLALPAERAVLRPGDGRLERWRRIAIEAAEQCGRAVVPTIAGGPFEARLNALVLIAVPGAEQGIGATLARSAGYTSLVLLVGPEGGWSPEEQASHLAAGAYAVGLGPRVLRAETAAVTGLARLVEAASGLG